jgi:hypothetical protein
MPLWRPAAPSDWTQELRGLRLLNGHLASADRASSGITPGHHTSVTLITQRLELLVSSLLRCYPHRMGEHRAQLASDRGSSGEQRLGTQTAETLGRRLLEILVYGHNCRIGGQVSPDDLDATEVGDWKMPDFKAARAYAASQGWLIVRDDLLMLTTAGLAAA